MITVCLVAAFGVRVRQSDAPEGLKRAVGLLTAAVLMQAFLGIATLLTVVPVTLGALHQAGAVLLLTAALWCLHHARR